ncbi:MULTISPECIES: helix-turn-helix domain-containing protein [unclassified Streptomyces]|uniref:helix-turn-helix domain-containing protein n=1 Tax=unclassified Streptomyces TaxID=2593676 RepID=UPI001EEF972B|nr:helix-turn-helix domain-containing protein [Streptomyces sp. PsTaAH-130]
MDGDDPRARTTPVGGCVRRAEDVLDMQRAARKGGTASLLRWLTVRTGAAVMLVERSGAMASSPPSSLGDAERDLVLRGVREITLRGLKSLATDQDGIACVVLPLDGPPADRAPFLAAVMPRPMPPEVPPLLADATSGLSLCWQMEHTRRQQRLLRIADARTREAVLHLLMNGQTTAARQVAGALGSTLPDVAWVYVIEGPHALRAAVAGAAAQVVEGAWIVPCPVYADHTMLLAAAGSAPHTGTPPQWTWPHPMADHCWVGVSEAVPLSDIATGYAQAFHALAVARHHDERHSAFAGNPDLTLTLGPAAGAWAEEFLAPLRVHYARRPQDPGSAELLATASSWLSFSSRATAHLKIHRNTLAARLTLVQQLLGIDLGRLADQSALALALRAIAPDTPPRADHHTTGTEESTPSLDELLVLPGVVEWARQRFLPVRAPDVPANIARTLTTWLRLDARIEPTAAALDISASAVRKRLARSETLLRRSLLRPPRAVHDQWLAQRALDLTGSRHPTGP